MIIKGLDALLEMIGGLLLLIPLTVSRWLLDWSQHEILKFHESRAMHLEQAAERVAHVSPLAAWYLIIHGLVKVVFIVAIFKNKVWGYKGLIIVLSVFGLCELVRGIAKHEVFAIVMAAFDGLIVYLIAKEYRARFGKTI